MNRKIEVEPGINSLEDCSTVAGSRAQVLALQFAVIAGHTLLCVDNSRVDWK